MNTRNGFPKSKPNALQTDTDISCPLKKVRDFSAAQVCTGGIHTEEIHTDTLESRIVPGIYFVGELLDVDGICGGYNLQWAWSSGHVAGSKVGS